MIDLRKKGLPNTVRVCGRPYSIYTDFRKWIEFSEIIKKKEVRLNELFYLFRNDIPHCDFSAELMDFFVNKNATPRGDGSAERLIDYVLDGEYITASFLQVYGIDLTECDIHWHKFKALLVSLPSDCKIGQIMADRGYKSIKKSYEELAKERKADWSLPAEDIEDEELQSVNDALNAEFYGTL